MMEKATTFKSSKSPDVGERRIMKKKATIRTPVED